MVRGNINRQNYMLTFPETVTTFFLFLVLFTLSDVLSTKVLKKSHFWTFMAAQVIYACRWWCRDGKQVVLFSSKQFALKLSGRMIFMSVHVRFFLLPHYQALRYLKMSRCFFILSSSLPQLFSVIFDVLLICY